MTISRTKPLKRSPIRRVSKKRSKLQRQRQAACAIVAKRSGGRCEIRVEECTWKATDFHEPLSRARGGSIIDELNILHCCRSCHDWIHLHPAEATERGFMKSRPAWMNELERVIRSQE